MACFIVPGTEAIVTTVATKLLEKHEQKVDAKKLETGMTISEMNKEHFTANLHRLNKLLWGGSALLAFEHVWHGELQPFFPFLTAAANPVDFAEMLGEMSTVGVTMAVLVTAAWGVMTLVSSKLSANDNVKVKKLQK